MAQNVGDVPSRRSTAEDESPFGISPDFECIFGHLIVAKIVRKISSQEGKGS
jgi:hypothetical protein